MIVGLLRLDGQKSILKIKIHLGTINMADFVDVGLLRQPPKLADMYMGMEGQCALDVQ